MRYVTLLVSPAEGRGFHPVGEAIATDPDVSAEAFHRLDDLGDSTVTLLTEVSGDADRYREILADSPAVHEFAVALAVAAGLLAALWLVLGTYTSSTETLRDGLTAADFAVFEPALIGGFVAAAAGSGGALGAATWELVVERRERWSVRRRGALAGGLTGLLAVPVTMALSFAVRPPSPMHPLAGATAGLFVGAIGLVYVGWTTVPVGAAVGYALGRRRAGHRSLAARVRRS